MVTGSATKIRGDSGNGHAAPIFSVIIPCKNPNDPKLQDLIESIKEQRFSQELIEIIVITNSEIDFKHLFRDDVKFIYTNEDSEQAKATGIRNAKGEICAMFCADNYITDIRLFSAVKGYLDRAAGTVGVYNKFFNYHPNDNSLNRYFSLIGNNDPIPFYLGKCDRRPYYEEDHDVTISEVAFPKQVPSLGCNGFFFRTAYLREAQIPRYYPMDACEDLRRIGKFNYGRFEFASVWHRTSDNFIRFLIKRYRYARDLYSDRTDRRWRIIDNKRDVARLGYFVISVMLVFPMLFLSFRGFRKVRDWAWFWHWPISVGFLITYTILAVRNCLKSRSLFHPFSVQTA